MNNIPDNPARVASPESPKGFSLNWKETARDLVEAYSDGSWEESSPCDLFAEALEEEFFNQGKAHHFMMLAFNPPLDDLNCAMIDFVNDFALQYVRDRV